MVKTAFNQRRKQLRNSLKPIILKEHPIFNDVYFDKRPEQLNVEEFIALTNKIEAALRDRSSFPTKERSKKDIAISWAFCPGTHTFGL